MKKVREEALKLRLKGYSYNEIQEKLGVPKSTQSGWFRNLQLSAAATKRLQRRKTKGTKVLIKRNKAQTIQAHKRAKKIQKESTDSTSFLSNRDLLIMGAALYWGEGYKRLKMVGGKYRTHHPISLVNADPLLVKAFLKFAVEILEVKRSDVRATMRLYKTINEVEARKYWADKLQLKEENFRKTTWLVSISSQRKKKFNRLPYGSLQIEIGDTEKFHKVMGFINGLKSAIK